MKFKALEHAEALQVPNKDPEAYPQTHLLQNADVQNHHEDLSNQSLSKVSESFGHRLIGTVSQILEELKAPPTIATVSSLKCHVSNDELKVCNVFLS